MIYNIRAWSRELASARTLTTELRPANSGLQPQGSFAADNLHPKKFPNAGFAAVPEPSYYVAGSNCSAASPDRVMRHDFSPAPAPDRSTDTYPK